MLRWASGWPLNKPGSRARRRAGLTLAEVAVSSLLVAVLLVTTLKATLVIHGSTAEVNQQTVWHLAANSLLEELRGLNYAEPDMDEADEEIGMGVDDNESVENRETWDDCDDANGFRTSRLTLRDGTLWGETAMRASIDVHHVSPVDLLVSGDETGLKRITIRVGDGGERDAVIQALVTEPPIRSSRAHSSILVRMVLSDGSKLQFTAAPRNRIEAD